MCSNCFFTIPLKTSVTVLNTCCSIVREKPQLHLHVHTGLFAHPFYSSCFIEWCTCSCLIYVIKWLSFAHIFQHFVFLIIFIGWLNSCSKQCYFFASYFLDNNAPHFTFAFQVLEVCIKLF